MLHTCTHRVGNRTFPLSSITGASHTSDKSATAWPASIRWSVGSSTLNTKCQPAMRVGLINRSSKWSCLDSSTSPCSPGRAKTRGQTPSELLSPAVAENWLRRADVPPTISMTASSLFYCARGCTIRHIKTCTKVYMQSCPQMAGRSKLQYHML